MTCICCQNVGTMRAPTGPTWSEIFIFFLFWYGSRFLFFSTCPVSSYSRTRTDPVLVLESLAEGWGQRLLALI